MCFDYLLEEEKYVRTWTQEKKSIRILSVLSEPSCRSLQRVIKFRITGDSSGVIAKQIDL